MAAHLENLIAEYLDRKGYFVKSNVLGGKRTKGGWEMELDIVAPPDARRGPARGTVAGRAHMGSQGPTLHQEV